MIYLLINYQLLNTEINNLDSTYNIFQNMIKEYNFHSSSLNLILLYSGDTGFMLAAMYGHLNILEFLLTKGSSVDEKNRDGKINLLFIFLSIYPSSYLSNYPSFFLSSYPFLLLSNNLSIYLSTYLIHI